jgi:hypothetical protein
MKNLKKFNELYINRDEPKTPFHGSQEPKKWGEQERHVPEPSSEPYISAKDDLKDNLSKIGLSIEDLDHFRSFMINIKDISREYKNNDQVYTDLLILSRLLKSNQSLIDKLMNLKEK